MKFNSKYLMYNFHLVKSNKEGRIHIMSKLRFQVIPVIISGSRLVSGGGVLTLSVGSKPVNLKLGQSDVTSLSNYPIDKQLRTAHLFLSSLIQAHVFVYKTN
jgi:hypothetical protein